MKVYKGIEVYLYPNVTQQDQIEDFGRSSRTIWNVFLGMQKDRYEAMKDNEDTKKYRYIGFYDMCKILTTFKAEDGNEWTKRTAIATLQNTLRDLDTAYKRFFKGLGGAPKFKSWRNGDDSITFSSKTCKTIGSKRIKFPKLGEIKYRGSYDLSQFDSLGKIKVYKDHDGRYKASVMVEFEPEQKPKTGLMIGIDLNSKSFATLDTGVVLPTTSDFNHNWGREVELQKKWSRKLSRRRDLANKHIAENEHAQSISNTGQSIDGKLNITDYANHGRAKQARARHYKHASNMRKDYYHKLTAKLVTDYDVIVIEDLQSKDMVSKKKAAKKGKYAKAIRDKVARTIQENSFYEFRSMLQYKCDWYGKQLIVVPPHYTSQTCHDCGHIMGTNGTKALNLGDRSWNCPKCGVHHDRDVNAAKNILSRGLEMKKTLDAAERLKNEKKATKKFAS